MYCILFVDMHQDAIRLSACAERKKEDHGGSASDRGGEEKDQARAADQWSSWMDGWIEAADDERRRSREGDYRLERWPNLPRQTSRLHAHTHTVPPAATNGWIVMDACIWRAFISASLVR